MTEYGLDLLEDPHVVILPVIIQTITIVRAVEIQIHPLLTRKILVGVRGRPFGGQDALLYAVHHVQLLQDGVHVTGGAGVLQAHETLKGPRSNGGKVVPFGYCGVRI